MSRVRYWIRGYDQGGWIAFEREIQKPTTELRGLLRASWEDPSLVACYSISPTDVTGVLSQPVPGGLEYFVESRAPRLLLLEGVLLQGRRSCGIPIGRHVRRKPSFLRQALARTGRPQDGLLAPVGLTLERT